MDSLQDIVWEGPDDRIVLSPSQGGRVIAWSHRGSDNLVREPQQFEGGLLRTLLAEEHYPGYSYCTPHQVISHEQTAEGGFRVHLRFFWFTPNIFARLFGWTEKVCPRYLDGLLLDKVVTFHAEASALSVELSLSNLTDSMRQVTPWVQNTFRETLDHGFVVRDGNREEYYSPGDYWTGHAVDGATSMRLVQSTQNEDVFVVLGADAAPLVGMLKYDPADFGDDATMGMQELRYQPIKLAAGDCWQVNYFVAMTEDTARWNTDAPVELYTRTQPTAVDWNDKDMLPLLAAWALPEERERGMMVFTFLDKLPFTSSSRFQPAHAIAGFHADGDTSPRATVALFALRDVAGVQANLVGETGWRMLDADHLPLTTSFDLQQHELRLLTVEAAAALAGKADVSLRITAAGSEVARLQVPHDVQVEPRYPYQFKQMASYLEERVRREKLVFTGETVEEFWAWQQELRARYQKWMRDSVLGPSPLEPRLLERQIGPTCVRDKIAIQTEPGMWLPSYVVYPKDAPAQMPAILLFHGSGPGKEAYAPDEEPADYMPGCGGHELFAMPYQLANKLGCLVYVPDQRSQGEWGESYSLKATRSVGYNSWAMRMWDHMRSLDYLCSRPDVDTSRIGCLGASGGGSATMYTAGVDERVTAAILSSMPPYLVQLPDQYFNNMWSKGEFEDGWDPLKYAPSLTANVCALTIPRALWIMDGTHDECWGSPRDPNAETIFAEARVKWQAGRDEIARLYALAGASDKFRESWFPGGHCSGMTVANAVEWFSRWF